MGKSLVFKVDEKFLEAVEKHWASEGTRNVPCLKLKMVEGEEPKRVECELAMALIKRKVPLYRGAVYEHLVQLYMETYRKNNGIIPEE